MAVLLMGFVVQRSTKTTTTNSFIRREWVCLRHGQPDSDRRQNSVCSRAGRRASHGLTLLGNYQFSKLMEAVTYLNNFQVPEYRIGQYDHPNHLSLAVTYDLPFGRGRRFASHINRFVDLAIGGFTLNSIYFYQTGAPLTFGNVLRSTAANGAGVSGINYNPRQVTAVSTTTSVPAFDTTQFSLTAPVENIRVFQSQFNITEKGFFEFRFEAFNVNNRPVSLRRI